MTLLIARFRGHPIVNEVVSIYRKGASDGATGRIKRPDAGRCPSTNKNVVNINDDKDKDVKPRISKMFI